MRDPIQLAKTARSILGQALQALQSSDDAPEELMDVAEPIAKTMGVLHRIERSGGSDLSEALDGLDNVRHALDMLQSIDTDHPAVDEAMEAVAGALGKLFSLTKAKPSRPAQEEPTQESAGKKNAPAAKVEVTPAVEPKPSVTARGTVRLDGPDADDVREHVKAQARATTKPSPAARPAAEAPAAPHGNTQPVPAQPQAAPQPVPAQPQAAPQPVPRAQPAPAPRPEPAPAPAAPQATLAQPPAGDAGRPSHVPEVVPGMEDAPPPPAGSPRFDVELGAHSPSNFYKGLNGNDVVDHGGIFVQTYQLPKMGAPVALRVLLPGDLEFTADAIVSWTREPRDGGADPGFGARFSRIPAMGRKLVYRYVRNREPMFYDDF